jgi:hypothetical protein
LLDQREKFLVVCVLPRHQSHKLFVGEWPNVTIVAELDIGRGLRISQTAIENQVIEKPTSIAEYADCVRFTEGPSPVVDVPAGLDVAKLAEIGLQVAGMTPGQASEFFQTVYWKSTLTLSVPRQLRSYEQVKVGGVPGTLLTLGGRRGPGYTLIWAKNGMAFSLTGYGDSGRAVELADSVK